MQGYRKTVIHILQDCIMIWHTPSVIMIPLLSYRNTEFEKNQFGINLLMSRTFVSEFWICYKLR